MNLQGLRISRVIMHRLPAGQSGQSLGNPILADSLLLLEEETRAFLADRCIEALGERSGALPMEVDDSLGVNTVDRIDEMIKSQDLEFIRISKSLAGLFHLAHEGRSVVPGIIFFLHGTVSNGSPVGVIIKADFHEAMQPGDDELRILHDLVLSSNSKFYKMAGVLSDDDKTISIRDEQSSRIDSPAASYFYKSFLGLKFAPSGPFITKAVYEAAKRAAIEVTTDPEDTMRVLKGINSMFFDETLPAMHPLDIADRYFESAGDRDRFNEVLIASKLPMESFAKDTSRLSTALQTSRIDLDNGVKIYYPHDLLSGEVEISSETLNGEAWTLIRVHGRII